MLLLNQADSFAGRARCIPCARGADRALAVEGATQLQCKAERPVSGAGLAERLSQVCMEVCPHLGVSVTTSSTKVD